MYTINLEMSKKLVDSYNLLNQIEIKGMQNLQLLYNAIYNIQEIIKEMEEQAKEKQNQGIVVDNTKKKEE